MSIRRSSRTEARRHPRARLAGVALGTGLALIASVTVGPAVTVADATPDPRRGTGAAAVDHAERIDELASSAERDGSVRVIVELSVPFAPEAGRSGAAVASQRRAIASQRAALDQELRGTGHRIARAFATVPFVALELPPAGVERLRDAPQLAGIVHDAAVPPAVVESSPLIRADVMWDSGHTGAGRTVAILDTGVEAEHEFFGGRVVEEACFSTTSLPAQTQSLCPDGTDVQLGPGAGAPCPAEVNQCDHGTHVAGIAAGSNEDFSGVAPDASVMSVQVFSRFDDPDDCAVAAPCVLAFWSDIIAGLERVYGVRELHDVASVNMSLGGGAYSAPCEFPAVEAVVDNLRAAGVATISSAGNDSSTGAIGIPACLPNVIAVASSTKGDEVAWYSDNHPTLVDLLAPGSTIFSAIPGGRYTWKSGTSMAAPQVAGAWALLRQERPDATPEEILDDRGATGLPVVDHRPGGGYANPRLRLAWTAASISGTVTDGDGYAVPNAVVRADGGSSGVAITDTTGAYEITGLADGETYSVKVRLCGGPAETVMLDGDVTLDLVVTAQVQGAGSGHRCALVSSTWLNGTTTLPLTGLDASVTIDLPFPFEFYGTEYDEAHVSTNGFLSFLPIDHAYWMNTEIPSSSSPDAAIYPFWDDLLVDEAASVRTGTAGTAPDRRFVIEWRNVTFWADTSRRISFAVILYEHGNRIRFAYHDIGDGIERGSSATIGIENADGSVALQASHDEASVATGLTVEIRPK